MQESIELLYIKAIAYLLDFEQFQTVCNLLADTQVLKERLPRSLTLARILCNVPQRIIPVITEISWILQ